MQVPASSNPALHGVGGVVGASIERDLRARCLLVNNVDKFLEEREQRRDRADARTDENTIERRSCYSLPMRVVGKRKHGTGDRAGLDALVLKFGGGAKKGVFRYRNEEEANRDWNQWMIERAQRRTTTYSE